MPARRPVHNIRRVAYVAIALIVLLIALFGALPVIASSQISSSEQSISTVVSHQATVDAGFTNFFAAAPASMSDPAAGEAEMRKHFQTVDEALAVVQTDEQDLSSPDQRLAILEVLALPSHGAIESERQRISTALSGLGQADRALTIGSEEGKVMSSYLEAMIDVSKMNAALGKRDLGGAASAFPDAQQKLQEAIDLAAAPGLPAGVLQQLHAANSLLQTYGNFIQAAQNRDIGGMQQYNASIQQEVKVVQSVAHSVPADWELKTFGPDLKAYDAAMNSLKG